MGHERRDGLGEMWDRWVEHLNAPEPEEDTVEHEPWTLRRVVETAAVVVAIVGVLALLDVSVGINWGWIPWKQIGVIVLVVGAIASGLARAVRSRVRRRRGLPPPREPTKRDRMVEKLRELDEPYLRRERSLTRD